MSSRIILALAASLILWPLSRQGHCDEPGTRASALSVLGRFKVVWSANVMNDDGILAVRSHTLDDVIRIQFLESYILLQRSSGGGRIIGVQHLVDLDWEPILDSNQRLDHTPDGSDLELQSGRPIGSKDVPVQLDANSQRVRWVAVDDFEVPIAQFPTVFWDPRDTVSIRQLIRETPLVRGKSVLEIGTGTGLLSLCCLQAEAVKVVATDVNPWAIGNAGYNAARLGLKERLDTRLVSREHPTAYPVIREAERFDLIISNPPWENEKPESYADFAYYDENFQLMNSLLADLHKHLKPGGKALLVYGFVDAIKKLQELAPKHDLVVRLLDERKLDELTPEFLPGMMLEVVPKTVATPKND